MTRHHRTGFGGHDWTEDRHGLWSAFILGVGMLALGTVLILDNFGTLDASGLVPYWPILLMVFGLSQLVQRPAGRRVMCGLTWVTVGAIILLNNLGMFAVGIPEPWPLILLIIGVTLLYRAPTRRRPEQEAPLNLDPRRWRQSGKETRHDTEK
jgi:hypothetical protein